MVSEKNTALRLLQTDDWIAALCSSGHWESVRQVLVHSAEIMLPYWEARFDKDESMSELTKAMRRFSSSPTSETQRTLESLIPRGRLASWDLSPLDGFFPDKVGSDCPADFAGDAIVYAARALVESYLSAHTAIVGSALEAMIEALARLFAERDPDDDNDVDHYSNAKSYVRHKLLTELVA